MIGGRLRGNVFHDVRRRPRLAAHSVVLLNKIMADSWLGHREGLVRIGRGGTLQSGPREKVLYLWGFQQSTAEA